MTYSVKEIFLTLQGEGGQAGRAAVFCRFTGCNLWTGREQDRAAAICNFCDTDFIGTDGQGGGKFADADALAEAVLAVWTGGAGERLVVCTGGEPLLQLDVALVAAHLVDSGGNLPLEVIDVRLAEEDRVQRRRLVTVLHLLSNARRNNIRFLCGERVSRQGTLLLITAERKTTGVLRGVGNCRSGVEVGKRLCVKINERRTH